MSSENGNVDMADDHPISSDTYTALIFVDENEDRIKTFTGDSIPLPEIGDQIELSHQEMTGSIEDGMEDLDIIESEAYEVESISLDYGTYDYFIEDDLDDTDEDPIEGDMKIAHVVVKVKEIEEGENSK